MLVVMSLSVACKSCSGLEKNANDKPLSACQHLGTRDKSIILPVCHTALKNVYNSWSIQVLKPFGINCIFKWQVNEINSTIKVSETKHCINYYSQSAITLVKNCHICVILEGRLLIKALMLSLCLRAAKNMEAFNHDGNVFSARQSQTNNYTKRQMMHAVDKNISWWVAGRLCRDGDRKAKAQLKLDFTAGAKENNKSFYRYINWKSKAWEGIVSLVRNTGRVETVEKKKAEIFKKFLHQSSLTIAQHSPWADGWEVGTRGALALLL